MKKQTHLHLVWPEGENIFSRFPFLMKTQSVTPKYDFLKAFTCLEIGKKSLNGTAKVVGDIKHPNM